MVAFHPLANIETGGSRRFEHSMFRIPKLLATLNICGRVRFFEYRMDLPNFSGEFGPKMRVLAEIVQKRTFSLTRMREQVYHL